MTLKFVDNLDDCGFDDKSHLQDCLSWQKFSKIFEKKMIEGQEIKILLTLRMWKRMNQLKTTF